MFECCKARPDGIDEFNCQLYRRNRRVAKGDLIYAAKEPGHQKRRCSGPAVKLQKKVDEGNLEQQNRSTTLGGKTRAYDRDLLTEHGMDLMAKKVWQGRFMYTDANSSGVLAFWL